VTITIQWDQFARMNEELGKKHVLETTTEKKSTFLDYRWAELRSWDMHVGNLDPR